MICWLFQVLKLMRAIIVTKDQPELLTVNIAQDNSTLRLDYVPENVHIDLSGDVLIYSCARIGFA